MSEEAEFITASEVFLRNYLYKYRDPECAARFEWLASIKRHARNQKTQRLESALEVAVETLEDVQAGFAHNPAARCFVITTYALDKIKELTS